MSGYSFICHTKVEFVWQTETADPGLPHVKGWISRGLVVSNCFVWQMLDYSFICHTKVEFVWQT